METDLPPGQIESKGGVVSKHLRFTTVPRLPSSRGDDVTSLRQTTAWQASRRAKEDGGQPPTHKATASQGGRRTEDSKSVDLRPVLCCSPMGDVLFLSRARTRAERFDRTMFMRKRRAVPRGAPRKNHTLGSRHLAQSTRDVGASGRCESVRGARYKYEPCQTRPPRC